MQFGHLADTIALESASMYNDKPSSLVVCFPKLASGFCKASSSSCDAGCCSFDASCKLCVAALACMESFVKRAQAVALRTPLLGIAAKASVKYQSVRATA